MQTEVTGDRFVVSRGKHFHKWNRKQVCVLLGKGYYFKNYDALLKYFQHFSVQLKTRTIVLDCILGSTHFLVLKATLSNT